MYILVVHYLVLRENLEAQNISNFGNNLLSTSLILEK